VANSTLEEHVWSMRDVDIGNHACGGRFAKRRKQCPNA
jgi:hypothetical protein